MALHSSRGVFPVFAFVPMSQMSAWASLICPGANVWLGSTAAHQAILPAGQVSEVERTSEPSPRFASPQTSTLICSTSPASLFSALTTGSRTDDHDWQGPALSFSSCSAVPTAIAWRARGCQSGRRAEASRLLAASSFIAPRPPQISGTAAGWRPPHAPSA